MEAQPRQVEYYLTKDGRCPFREWFDSLRDNAARAQVDKRIGRLRLGSLGDWDDVGNGVIELRFKGVGPGYRIYCGQDGPALVILLCGGVKRGHQNDIDRAREYWRDYKAD